MARVQTERANVLVKIVVMSFVGLAEDAVPGFRFQEYERGTMPPFGLRTSSNPRQGVRDESTHSGANGGALYDNVRPSAVVQLSVRATAYA